MAKSFSSLRLLAGIVFITATCASCSSSEPIPPGPSQVELEDQANAQRELLLERYEYQKKLEAQVTKETQAVADKNIATNPVTKRRPFVGVTVAEPR